MNDNHQGEPWQRSGEGLGFRFRVSWESWTRIQIISRKVPRITRS